MANVHLALFAAASIMVLSDVSGAQTAPAAPPIVRLTPDASPPSGPESEQIVVRASKLNQARSQLQPSLGATVYKFDAKALQQIPQGSNAPLSQVLLQAPGVAEDSYGQLHVRGDHNEVQYRLDGVELPEGVSVFGQALEARFAHSIAFITGSLPAQYGQLQAAVVDITTKTGLTNPGGEISVYGGARDYLQPSFSYGGRNGDWDYFITGDFLHSRVGIENPTSSFNALHDLSNQYHGLFHLSYTPDDTTRLSLIGGISNAQFQIPNNPGQIASLGLNVNGVTSFDSSNLTEHQREITDFSILSLQKHFDGWDVQSSLFSRYSSLYFTPDPVGDLLFTGLAQTAAKSVWSSGTQTDATWYATPSHTVRAGFQLTGERLASETSSSVFFLDPSGVQTAPFPSTLQNGAGKTGGVYGAYIQDEWKLLPNVTLNYGGRFDLVDEFTHENQFSPRVNLVWQADADTTLHAGYSHYFTPPPFELIPTNLVSQFNGTTNQSACPPGSSPLCRDGIVRAEHDNYYDAGIEHFLLPGLRLGVDGYFKSARNLIDEGQFGAPIILTVFNYAHGQAGGVEFSASYDRGPWSLYGNLSISRAIGKDINSAQFTFSPDDLAYISHHYIHLDHDERFAGSAGVAYAAFRGSDTPARLSADVVTGSGLRADGTAPNGRALPGYYVINLAATETLTKLFLRGVEFRLDAINLLDRRYQIRDGSGIGVGAPQFGLRRTFLAGVTQRF
jgi:outer membrane receptor protein involved in Fe transport